jgi:hypothetical protein
MRCYDTLWGFVIFFTIGVLLASFPRRAREIQIFFRSKIPFGNSVPFGSAMKKEWSVTLIRWQGCFFLAFSLFLLQWYLRHCR